MTTTTIRVAVNYPGGDEMKIETITPTPAVAIDSLLRARGFERGYYHGGPRKLRSSRRRAGSASTFTQ
jgi:hypothetical protein